MDAKFWNSRYEDNNFPWDIGGLSPAIQHYLDKIEDKDTRILIPGAGHAHEAKYLFNQGFTKEFIDGFHTTKRGFCMLMLDLDHFKQVNDEHGHPAGDQVLMHCGELIRSHVRHGDIPFRYGGEEFVVLLKGDQIEDAVRTAERIRLEAAKMVLQIDDIPSFSITVSIGVACFPHHFTTANDLVNAADTALYDAKHNGRNQVVVYCADKAN